MEHRHPGSRKTNTPKTFKTGLRFPIGGSVASGPGWAEARRQRGGRGQGESRWQAFGVTPFGDPQISAGTGSYFLCKLQLPLISHPIKGPLGPIRGQPLGREGGHFENPSRCHAPAQPPPMEGKSSAPEEWGLATGVHTQKGGNSTHHK